MTVDSFIPTLWSEKFIKALDKAHVYANAVNRDYEGEIKAYGDTVRVNTVGPVTIADYTKNVLNLTPELIQGTGQAMTIDQAKYFYFALDDVDKAQTKGSVMEQAMNRASYGMKDTTDSYLATIIAAGVPSENIVDSGVTDSSTSNPILLGTGAGDVDAYELLVALGTQMNRANVPGGDRWIVVDPGFVGLLLIDPRFTGYATTQALDVLKSGSNAGPVNGSLNSTLSTLTGFNVMVSNNVPVSGSVYTILAGYKGAVSYAEQIAEGQPEAFRLQTGFADAVRGLHLYGAKVFEPAGLASAYVQYV